MKEYEFEGLRILFQEPSLDENERLFNPDDSEKTLRFHRSLPQYRQTELVSLSSCAEKYGIRSIFVKDESSRFGLKAFKGLGGSYAMFRMLCEIFSMDPDKTDFTAFQDEGIRKKCAEIHFITCTDGNHGKGVSWAAQMFGCKAHVYMPKGTVEVRRKAVEEAGSAVCTITGYDYDETVKMAARIAEEQGWLLIQDTAWDGYEKIPRFIIEGYLTMAAEIREQMHGADPTHVFLQAGVGSMAGGIADYFLSTSAVPPLIGLVEPDGADCFYVSAKEGEGLAHSVKGDCFTIMAGLNCGTPCKTVWPLLRDSSAFFCSCSDMITELGMRTYARPEGNDRPIISGESGAVTYGLLLTILRCEKLRKIFRINSDSVVLVINTEGDTDPDDYRRVISRL